jgi:hypothetical protein
LTFNHCKYATGPEQLTRVNLESFAVLSGSSM